MLLRNGLDSRFQSALLVSIVLFITGCNVSDWLKIDSTKTATTTSPVATPDESGTQPRSAVCPTNFIRMPASVEAQLGYSLCVAKYEMKVSLNDGTAVSDGRGTTNLDPALYLPVSRAAGTPWTRLTYAENLSECASLGAQYSLLSNREWDVLALDIASVSSNWSLGRLRSGHSDGTTDASAQTDGWTFANSGGLLAAGSDSNGYEGTGNSSAAAFGSGGEQIRVFTTSDGQIIWDLSGNARERVDIDGQGGTVSYSGGPSAYIEVVSAAMTSFISVLTSSNGVTFGSSTFQPSTTSWTHSSQNIGRFYIPGGVVSLRVITRGGNLASGNSPGLFAGDADEISTGRSSTGGFRCVYQP